MKLEDLRVGDRFRHVVDGDIWEVIDATVQTTGDYKCICIDPANAKATNATLGEATNIDLDLTRWWGYVGNYSKTDNFTTLYNLLNL